MPLKTSFATCLFSCLVIGAQAAPSHLIPLPAHLTPAQGELAVSGPHRPAKITGDQRVQDAAQRAIAFWAKRAGGPVGAGISIKAEHESSALPQLGEDESYSLTVSPDGVDLQAPNDLGVLHGLATLTQLMQHGDQGWFWPCETIEDQPRFAWRGLLIDVCRHFEPKAVILRNLDGMALVKLNVLHFHVSEDQGFRIECKSHPELTAEGSNGQFYTQDDVREIIAYAAARGIRVVPEFDVPGHATSWLVSHPELASAPGPFILERGWGVENPVFDPTNEGTYRLLGDVFAEMAQLFPDPYFHIGGDENNGKEWTANPRIQAFIREHQLKDNAGLQSYFSRRAGEILVKLGKHVIGWDEILHPDLPRGDIIESWRGSAALAKAAQMGFQGILAHGYYIDNVLPAADHYAADPLPVGTTLTPEEQKRVLGGEATMWGEWVEPQTIDSRIWPRTAVIAERLWSPQTAQDVEDMYRRMDGVAGLLTEIGLHHETDRVPMIARLAAGGDVAALTDFIQAVRPVLHLGRGKQQPNTNQYTVFIGVADAAIPDAPEVRAFAHLKDPATIRAQLERWRQAGRTVRHMAQTNPGLAEIAPLAMQLEDAADVGIEALKAGTTAQQQALWPVRLEADAQAHDGAELAILPTITQLTHEAVQPPHAPTPVAR